MSDATTHGQIDNNVINETTINNETGINTMNLTIEQKQEVYENLLTIGCPDLLAALIAERSTWHILDKEPNSISYEILHRFDWMHTPEGYNFWVDMYDDIYEQETGNIGFTIKPETVPIIKPTLQLVKAPIIALILWTIMICMLAALDL